MPVFQLPEEEHLFPKVELAEEDGLLAVGGDLSPGRLLTAYQMGIFPWYNEDSPILWWSPNPRWVLEPAQVHVSRSMAKVLKRGTFRVSFDEAFDRVIEACRAAPRPGQDGTWLVDDMVAAYNELHQLGFAHSVEVWQEHELVGGMYGISLGGCFFGESMFSKVTNSSKTALIGLARKLESHNFLMIDCQVHTPHLESMGAQEMPRSEFVKTIRKGMDMPMMRGNWNDLQSR
jgi:leucyl/phenylalanyl-tRNA--protein transferase